MTPLAPEAPASAPGRTSANAGIFSVDDHVLEHPRVWSDRMSETTWGDRIPRLLRDDTLGTDYWVIDGQRFPLHDVAQIGALRGDRASGPTRWEHVPDAAQAPAARLVAMDVDGVLASVLYPLVCGVAGQRFAAIADPLLERDCAAAYNDYIVDEWVAASPRFIGQAIVPVGNVDLAVAEIQRSVRRGHRGIMLPGNPALIRDGLPHINEPHWDPVWRAAQELGVPVAFHAGSSSRIQMPPYSNYSTGRAAALEAMTRPVSSTFLLANLLFSGVLVRFPELKVVFTETTLAWAAYTLESAKHQFGRQRYDMAGWDVDPIEQFRRQIYVTGWYDRTGPATRHHIGVRNMLWSTNFPQATSCWPRSSAVVEDVFAGVPADERADILRNNAQSVYGEIA